MRKGLYTIVVLLGMQMTANAQNVEIESGPYKADYQSLSDWECPEWFKDAKLGFWAHWGPQCHAEDGDWYGRFMYYAGSGQYNWHVSHFGNPKDFGLKDLCHDWKAQNWDPDELVTLYKSAGARYFMALGNHHDNFDLWNSTYQEWNSVNVGPEKDILKGWSDACKKNGLPLGVSFHASHAWSWLEPSQDYDGNLTKEDGKGTWWEGMDPQELYAQRHPHSSGWNNSGTIHSQWNWGNGVSLPSAEYKMKFQNRVLQCINDYNPSMIYFDDTAMPFYGCDDAVGQNILAHYYNKSAKANGGKPNVVVTGKVLTPEQKQYMMWDVERGIPDRPQEKYWQTCTCIGGWHYSVPDYQAGAYKSAQTVIRMLIDIVSKNGNLLLSVPVKSDGTIDEKERKIVNDIKAWMDINGESIYGTRVWTTFGEGPLADAANPINSQGFNEGQSYSSSDVRYVHKGATVYATIMVWPTVDEFQFKAFSLLSPSYCGQVKRVQLLGHGDVKFTHDAEGLTVEIPKEHPNEIAPAFKIEFEETSLSMSEQYKELLTAAERLAAKARPQAEYYNTGKYSPAALSVLEIALKSAKKQKASQESFDALRSACSAYMKNARNEGGQPTEAEGKDVTSEYLGESSNFSRRDGLNATSRFSAPKYWTVENYSIPQRNAESGVKEGIDSHSGKDCLMLGLWDGDDRGPYKDELADARLYKKVTLPAGKWFFGAKYNTAYNLGSNAYMFVSTSLISTASLPDKSMAYYEMSKAGENGKFDGVNFYLSRPTEVYLGWQADLKEGAKQREFRVEEITLKYYGK